MAIVGDKALLRNLFTLLVDTSESIVATATTSILVETVEADQHSFYVYSVYESTSGGSKGAHQTYFHANGAGDQAIDFSTTNGLHCALRKSHVGGSLNQVVVELLINNHAAGSRTVKIKVYRIAGLT